MMPENVAVVVTYNRKALLQECLESLLGQIDASLDIILVDNNSSDGTEKLEVIKNPRIQYFRLERNIGGAGGFNYGIKKAVEFGYRYIWIMDDDTIPEADALAALVSARKLLEDDFGFLSSYVKWTNGEFCKMNATFPYDWWVESEKYLKDGLLRIISASFVSLYVKADVVKKVGLPIKDFFIWGDDIEFTTRITEKYPCYFCDDSVVVHKTRSNTGADIFSDDGTRLKNYEYLTRNDFYVRKRKGFLSGVKYFVWTIVQIIRIAYKAPNYRIKKCCAVFKGLMKGMFFNPQIEYC